jgi:hypothetical protein
MPLMSTHVGSAHILPSSATGSCRGLFSSVADTAAYALLRCYCCQARCLLMSWVGSWVETRARTAAAAGGVWRGEVGGGRSGVLEKTGSSCAVVRCRALRRHDNGSCPSIGHRRCRRRPRVPVAHGEGALRLRKGQVVCMVRNYSYNLFEFKKYKLKFVVGPTLLVLPNTSIQELPHTS